MTSRAATVKAEQADAKPIPLASPWLPPECADAVHRQVSSTFVGPGAASEEFASQLAKICEIPAAVPTASGTVALSVAAQVIGLKPGDEVIIPAYGVISVINACAIMGLRPRLADIDPASGCLAPARVEQVLRPETRAVLHVDFCGSIGPELDQITAICAKHGAALIEDAAWSLGRGKPGRRGGSFGSIAATSFSVPKLITTGQGGAVLLHDVKQREAAIAAIDQGDTEWRRTNLNRGIGTNLRLSDLAASLGIAQLAQLEERRERKRRVFSILEKWLGERLLHASDGEPPMQYIVFVEDPDSMAIRLREQGILAVRQYRPYYHHPPFAALKEREYPAAEFWNAHALYLPFGVGLEEEDAERIGQAVARLPARFLHPPRA